MVKIHLFPDTNLFFQCNDIPSLPWADLGAFAEVELIVTRPIQKEIDRRKGEMTTRLGKRARKAHSLLRKVIENQLRPIVLREKNPQVMLALQVGLKPNSALANTLDYEEADDRLVGIASTFLMANAESEVAVLTHDGGVMASAVSAGIKHYAIPDTWLAPPEETKGEKELKAARAEIQRLSSAEPRFEIACIDSHGRTIDRLVLQYPHVKPLSAEEVEALLQRARESFPRKADFTLRAPPLAYSSGGFPIEALKGLHMSPTERQIAAYHAAYEKWEAQLEASLGTIHRWFSSQESTLTASFRAENVGTRPAEKALVEFSANGHFFVGRPDRSRDKAEKNQLPSPPAAPTRPIYPTLESAMFTLGWLDRTTPSISPSLYPPKPRDAERFYYKTGGFGSDMQLTCDLWRHGRGGEEFEVLVHPLDYKEASGAIEFKIHAGNLTHAVSTTVPVEIHSPTLSTFDFAKNLIDQLEEKDCE